MTRRFKRIQKVFNIITAFIIVMFFVATCFTFVSDFLVANRLFGDKLNDQGDILVYSARHIWYNTSLCLLTIISIIRLGFSIDAIVEGWKNEDRKNGIHWE